MILKWEMCTWAPLSRPMRPTSRTASKMWSASLRMWMGTAAPRSAATRARAISSSVALYTPGT